MAKPIDEALFNKAHDWIKADELFHCGATNWEVVMEARDYGFTDQEILDPSFWLGVIRALNTLMH